MIRACIFDLDGTTLYTLESIARAGNRMLEAMGFSPRPLEEYRFYCGEGADMLVERVLKKVDGYSRAAWEEGCRLNRRFLAEAPMYGVRPYKGMEKALASLKDQGIRLAVFTNKPDKAAGIAIKAAFGQDLFDLVQGDSGRYPLKPDPAGALAISRHFGLSPEECLYFGDSATDMKTARAAGMIPVGCLWGYRTREELTESRAAFLIGAPDEIPGLVDRLNDSFSRAEEEEKNPGAAGSEKA